MSSSIDYPLRTTLRVEALRGHEVGGLIGQERAVRSIVDYLAEHNEGRFLISGFAGVGKSSLVRRVLNDIRTHPQRGTRPLVLLELPARSLDDPEIIGKRLVWSLRWEVQEGRVSMESSQRARLLEAFDGVAASSVEREASDAESVKATAGAKTVGLEAEASKSTERRQKAVYVPYDVQTSLLEVGQLIAGLTRFDPASNRPFWKRVLLPLEPSPPPLVVVVIDRVARWDVLQRLGNLFASPGAVFLVIAPPEVRAAWIGQDAAGHDDLAGFQDIYLGCLWDDLPRLLERYLDVEAASAEAAAIYPQLTGFLTFASGGIPRKCVQLLLKYRALDAAGRPVIQFDRRALRTIEFYHGVFGILSKREPEILGEYFTNFEDADRDRARRCMIASAREIVSRGTVSRRDPMATMSELAEALRPPEQRHIVANLTRVLVDEGLLVASGNEYTLSASARENVAKGRAILGTGILPRIEVEGAKPADRRKPAAPPEPPGPATTNAKRRPDDRGTTDADTIGESTQRLVPSLPNAAPSPNACSECGTEYPRSVVFCPSCGAERLEGRTTPLSPGEDRLLERLRDALSGRYEILGIIGRGGMGSVYLAHDRNLERRVALKVLGMTLSFDEASRERFLREARVAARLSHQNIAAIYDLGSAGELAYFAMAYVPGGTLEDRIRDRTRLGIREACTILAPIARALGAAHEQGIVHRDMKPSNVLIDERGKPFLCDFGIAKASDVSQALTMSGAVIGTPYFMSPEQARGMEIGPASDQYSFGVTLYYAVTGQHPFGGDSMMQVMFGHVSEPAPEISSSVGPQMFAAAVKRMLAKTPEERFRSMTDVAELLEEMSG